MKIRRYYNQTIDSMAHTNKVLVDWELAWELVLILELDWELDWELVLVWEWVEVLMLLVALVLLLLGLELAQVSVWVSVGLELAQVLDNPVLIYEIFIFFCNTINNFKLT